MTLLIAYFTQNKGGEKREKKGTRRQISLGKVGEKVINVRQVATFREVK